MTALPVPLLTVCTVLSLPTSISGLSLGFLPFYVP
jgi:hypothetical protein